MAGSIRTKEKCQKCGKTFAVTITKRGNKPVMDMVCCGTRPRAFYVYVYLSKSRYPDGPQHLRLYSDQSGNNLSSYDHAHRLIDKIRGEMDARTFDVTNYRQADLELFRGRTKILRWMETKKHLAPTTRDAVKSHVDKYLMPYFGNMDMRELSTSHVEDFMAQLPGHLSPKTRKNIMASLGSLARWLYRRNRISVLPQFPVISVPTHPIRYINREEQMRILKAIPEQHRSIFQFMMYHPLRSGEVRALRVKDFDLDRWAVHVERAFSMGELRSRKNGRDYYLPLSQTFDQSILNDKTPEAWAFTISAGRPYSKEYLPKIWSESLAKAGIKHIPLKNATRHSVASQAYQRGVRMESISRALGHSDTRVTAERYAKVEVESLVDVVNDNVVEFTAPVLPRKKNRDRKAPE